MKEGVKMDWDVIQTSFQSFGYIGLFLWLWLGLYIFPVPNEILVAGIGLLTNEGLSSIPAFVTAYVGIVASATTSYLFGRMSDMTLFRKIKKRKAYVKATELIAKHGRQALWFSPFIPGARHGVPFLCGIRNLPFFTFAKIVYISSFIWCSFFFFTGKYFIKVGIENIEGENIYWLSLIIVAAMIIVYIRHLRAVRREEETTSSTH